MGDLFNIQPFGNVLVKLDIKGKDLVDIIEAQISPQFGPDYSISGFSYSYDPLTYKVVDLKLPDGSSVVFDKTYTLTVNNFMATATGSKYAPIGRLGKNPETGPEDLEATVAFVKSFEELLLCIKRGPNSTSETRRKGSSKLKNHHQGRRS
ncbi:5'-nucleotidase C-terminal domain-containing protein [Bacillus sp. B6(2022)]|nr:5'-nucleotidase C-terminal domain-containing protein [Bacillus sp. B6(2022)]